MAYERLFLVLCWTLPSWAFASVVGLFYCRSVFYLCRSGKGVIAAGLRLVMFQLFINCFYIQVGASSFELVQCWTSSGVSHLTSRMWPEASSGGPLMASHLQIPLSAGFSIHRVCLDTDSPRIPRASLYCICFSVSCSRRPSGMQAEARISAFHLSGRFQHM